MTQELVGFDPGAAEYLNSYTISKAPLQISTVLNAFIAPARPEGPTYIRSMFGGVYNADGKFERSSAQPRANGEAAIIQNQPEVSIPLNTNTLHEGIYGGILFDHFGHFILESTARLWAIGSLPPNLPVIFIGPPPAHIRTWHYDFLSSLGLDRERVIITHEWLRVLTLCIPDTGIQYHNWVASDYLIPFQKDTLPLCSSRRTWLSRSDLKFGYTVGEMELEEYIRQNGWQIVKPECLSAQEQIALFRSNTLLMGVQGSAFHNALFSPPGRQIIQLCRSQAHRAYYMLDKLGSLDVTYFNASQEVAGYPPFASSGPFLLNLDATIDFLRQRNLVSRTRSKPASFKAKTNELKLSYIAWWHHTNSHEQKYSGTHDQPPSEAASLLSAKTAAGLNPSQHVFQEHLISQTRAVENSLSALTISLNASKAFPLHARYHYFSAYFYDELGRYAEALSHSEVALRLAPSDLEIQNRHALQLFRVRELNGAAAIIEHITATATPNQETYYLRSLIEDALNDGPAAVRSASLAAGLSPSENHALHHLSLALKYNDLEDAEELAYKYASRLTDSLRGAAILKELNSRLAATSYQMSLEECKLSNYETALQHAQLAHDKAPADLSIEAHLINMLFQTGHIDRALALAESAMQRHTKNGVTAYLLSVMLSARGRTTEALHVAKIAASLEPKNSIIAERVELLERRDPTDTPVKTDIRS